MTKKMRMKDKIQSKNGNHRCQYKRGKEGNQSPEMFPLRQGNRIFIISSKKVLKFFKLKQLTFFFFPFY